MLTTAPSKIVQLHPAKTRSQILCECIRIRQEIRQNFIDTEHWNTHCRPFDVVPINPDPDGQMASLAKALDETIAREETMPGILWALHIEGPDELRAAPSRAAAVEQVALQTPIFEKWDQDHKDDPHWPRIRAHVVPWPHSDESHAASVKNWAAMFEVERAIKLSDKPAETK